MYVPRKESSERWNAKHFSLALFNDTLCCRVGVGEENQGGSSHLLKPGSIRLEKWAELPHWFVCVCVFACARVHTGPSGCFSVVAGSLKQVSPYQYFSFECSNGGFYKVGIISFIHHFDVTDWLSLVVKILVRCYCA